MLRKMVLGPLVDIYIYIYVVCDPINGAIFEKTALNIKCVNTSADKA